MSRHLSRQLGPLTTEEALAMLVGRQISSGQFRDVYECPTYSGSVLKVSREHANISNVFEWMIWGELAKTKWAKWLAPCESISPCGTVLLMRKCGPLVRRPQRVPSFLSDFKPENWGTLDSRPVCLDYGNNAVFFELLKVVKMKAPSKWFSNSGQPGRRTK